MIAKEPKEYRKSAHYITLLKDFIWKEKARIKDISICKCDYKTSNTPPPLESFIPFDLDGAWGGEKEYHAWFHFTVGKTEENEYLKVETADEVWSGWNAANPQFIAYIDGKLKQGMDTYHRELLIGERESTEVYLYAYIGAYKEVANLNVTTQLLNTDVQELYYDLLYPFQMLGFLDTESAEYNQILTYIYNAVSLLDMNEVGSDAFFKSVKEADKYLADTLYSDYCRDLVAKTACIGHTHIDCAWHWTFKQTREKVQRSFSTAIELMKRYPEYKFMLSQPLLYKYLKEEAPEVYEEVKQKVKEGRWECEGSMWVEADCNLTSGESLVRQILYGKNFFKEEFGVDNKILWLPDVFGYSAALPQILKKSGIDWFVTSKISWNEADRMPYDTFFWQGIDGTKINTQFITSQPADRGRTVNFSAYNHGTDANIIHGAYKRYTQKNLSNEVIMPFGHGDGGGGPTAEHLELLRRAARGIPGGTQGSIELLGSFLKRLAEKIEGNPHTPTWQGELYLEFHRGTYTTIGKNKKNNRYCEFLYAEAELMATMAKELFSLPFPKQKLHRGWEEILTNQFHDVIPGSSIQEVYDQCDIDYAWVKRDGEEIVNSAKERIAASLDKKHGYVVFNPHSFTADSYIKLDGKTVKVSGIPSKGYSVCSSFTDSHSIKYDGKAVETDVLRVTFDDCYQIVSIYDKVNRREVVKKGTAANELRLYADYPDSHDAWEWQEFSRDCYKTVTEFDSAERVDDGARMGIKITRSFGGSRLVQTIWFYEGTSKIDFETYVDWHSKHNMLKTAFPCDINASRATYEIQFGTVERPTHFNTSWDKAKFEVCAQKYADLSEGSYGVSLMNNCKYGHDIHDGVIQLSLLRAPEFPYRDADIGEHTFTYSLYPHSGDLNCSDTARQAYLLNYPLTALKAIGDADLIPTSKSLVSIDSDHVICETVKEEEKGNGTVLRLYEHKNMRDSIELDIGMQVSRAELTDLAENKISDLSIENGKIRLEINPFEIITVKLS